MLVCVCSLFVIGSMLKLDNLVNLVGILSCGGWLLMIWRCWFLVVIWVVLKSCFSVWLIDLGVVGCVGRLYFV